jgi:NADPH:quinone reductase-like Zn-dependent oxidoreductase
MKAMVRDAYSSPDMLDLNDIDKPIVGDDLVFGSCDRTFAEYACARADGPALMPTNVTFEQAAAVPTSAFTAPQGLRNSRQVQAGRCWPSARAEAWARSRCR